jgi:hypothetical protein
MARKSLPKKPKLTDAERHKRFVETAKKVGASDSEKDFEKAFSTIARKRRREKDEVPIDE